jgi:hypothetical protein
MGTKNEAKLGVNFVISWYLVFFLCYRSLHELFKVVVNLQLTPIFLVFGLFFRVANFRAFWGQNRGSSGRPKNHFFFTIFAKIIKYF